MERCIRQIQDGMDCLSELGYDELCVWSAGADQSWPWQTDDSVRKVYPVFNDTGFLKALQSTNVPPQLASGDAATFRRGGSGRHNYTDNRPVIAP